MEVMLNMIRMEMYRMFKTKCMYIIWFILAAGILFTTGLSAEEMKIFSMEEKQEMYEYAMGKEESDNVNLGMDVTVPTKPGENVSVFDLFYANIKGKFIALFMVIFTVLYTTADLTSGYVKNIAGQVSQRGGLVIAKALSLFVYTVMSLLIFFLCQTLSNLLFFEEFTLGPVKQFAAYVGIQLLLHYGLLMIVMGVAIALRNNVISMVIAVCFCMNVLMIFYNFLDQLIAKLGVKEFHIVNYTVSGKMLMLGMDISAKTASASIAVAIFFSAAAVAICSMIFQRRDV